MAATWMTKNGKKILYQDYRNLSLDDMLKTADEAYLMTKNEKDRILVLINVTNAFLVEKFMNKIKEIGKAKDNSINKSAIVGITGIKKVILNAFNAFLSTSKIKAFDTEEEAIAFLLKE